MMENNHDRGRIKWTAMMLPEHVEKLREWVEEDNQVERPELNEWDLQSIQEEMELACKGKCDTVVRTWEAGRVVEQRGIIEEINLQSMCIVLQDPFGVGRIPVLDIIGVRNVD